jgi:hypothetical protein
VECLFEEEVEMLTKAWKNLEAGIPGIKAEIDRLRLLLATHERRSEGIKQIIMNAILNAGLPKPSVKTSIGTVRVQNNPPSVVYDGDAKNLPQAYRLVIPISYQADKKAISEDWKRCEEFIAGELKKDPSQDPQELEHQWRTQHDFPQEVNVIRGKHIRLAV